MDLYYEEFVLYIDFDSFFNRIAAKLKRQINQLKKDRIVGAGGKLYDKIDDDLDKMIEKNLTLQDEEHSLTMQVKRLQKKYKTSIGELSSNVKKLRSTVDGKTIGGSGGHRRSGSRSPTKRDPEFVRNIEFYRTKIVQSNKTIEDMKKDIELSRRTVSGSIGTDELNNELRKREL